MKKLLTDAAAIFPSIGEDFLIFLKREERNKKNAKGDLNPQPARELSLGPGIHRASKKKKGAISWQKKRQFFIKNRDHFFSSTSSSSGP